MKKVASGEQKKEAEPPEKILDKIFVGRAWEVFEAARRQYPQITKQIEGILVQLASSGQLKGPISGEELLWFFRRLGLDVRLEIRIRVLESGELKTLEEKLRGK